jgi:mono/diheme cytochrome c family protein
VPLQDSTMRVLLRALLPFATLALAACGGMTSTPDAGSPSGNVSNGQALFINRGCGGCHGPNGEGLAGTGPNISGNATAGIGAWTQAEFNKALRQAIGRDGVAFCPNMQAYSFNDTQLADLFAFLKSKDSANPERGPASCR